MNRLPKFAVPVMIILHDGDFGMPFLMLHQHTCNIDGLNKTIHLLESSSRHSCER